MSFSFKGGSSLDPKNKEGSTNLMVSLLDEEQKILRLMTLNYLCEKWSPRFPFNRKRQN